MKKKKMKVLFLGCHCDDIELGAGATIHKHREDWDIHCHVLCNKGFNRNAIVCLKTTTRKSLHNLGVPDQNITLDNFDPNHYENQRNEIWKSLNEIKKSLNPDLVISQIEDEHQDHVTLYKETIRVFRESNLYLYLSSLRSLRYNTGDLFEIVSLDDVEKKIKSIKMYEKALGPKIFLKPE